MKTKAMVVGSMAAFVLLVGVSIFAAGSGLSDDAVPAGDMIGDILREGQDNGQGDMKRVMNEECVLDEPQKTQEQAKDGSCGEDGAVKEGEQAGEPEQTQEQAREQTKDGSCEQEGEQAGEPEQTQEQAREQTKDGSCDEYAEEVDADVLSAPIHDRDRDQVNGGTGPQYRNGEE